MQVFFKKFVKLANNGLFMGTLGVCEMERAQKKAFFRPKNGIKAYCNALGSVSAWLADFQFLSGISTIIRLLSF